MSRAAGLNAVLAVIAVGLVAAFFVLEARTDDAAATTTTTSTSTTTTTTTTLPTTTTSTTTTTTTSTTTSTTTTTVPPTTEVPVDRFFVAVVVVNGTTQGELLDPVVERVRTLGHFSVRGLNGQVQVVDTRIYALDEEFLGEAEVLATDLGFDLDDIEIETFAEAPPVSGLIDAKLMLYLGSDPLPGTPPSDEA